MTGEKAILSIIPTVQAANLLGRIARKKKKRKLVGDAFDIFTGTSFIQTESQLINNF